MGKRIWKWPGTKARERALRRSASRMARDLLKATPEKGLVAEQSYWKNKRRLAEKERRFLSAAINMSGARRKLAVANAAKELEHLKKQLTKVSKRQLDNLLGGLPLEGASWPAALKRERNAIELDLSTLHKMLETLRFLEKNSPKGKAIGFREEKLHTEKVIKQLQATLAKRNEDIEEERGKANA